MKDSILFLLNKYKNDEVGFKEAYMSLDMPFKKSERELLENIEDELLAQFSEDIAYGIDKHILSELIWMCKDDYLRKGLRKYKLNRILDGKK